jgi:hypothetical protein
MQDVALLRHLGQVGAILGADALRFAAAWGRSRTVLAAENLCLRKQLALYREREVTPRRATAATRLVLVLLARVFAWRDALLLVQPATLIRWHRQAFRLWWRWRSRGRGRPRIPAELRRLIKSMAQDNPTLYSLRREKRVRWVQWFPDRIRSSLVDEDRTRPIPGEDLPQTVPASE